ncbi:hypothetical protein [Vreelandella boliviensis]|uniref:hypothetical protein n=1 Tax=Vreelandella boliviensis TaxID=223527 RepID=UPI001B8B762F|nr:hypothetical protein [Halomonas boliviensis]MBS3668072.1 hypothetical protein [Halomonas boliviensis]
MSDESNMPPDAQGQARNGQARHAGNAEARWRALTSYPDFCQVGDKIVGFDSEATLGNPVNYSPNVITGGQRTYRVGDLCQGTEGNDGSGVGSGTSQGSGHVLFLTGQDNVKANGQPVVHDGSECTINCNAAGAGGAKGYVHTNTESVNSQPEETSETLTEAERFQQEAQANLERVGELREALNDNPTGKTSEQALALRAQVEELAQTVEHQQQAMMEASRNGTLSDDELHDLMDYINETTVSVLDLQDNAGRQTARANAKGTWVDFLIGFNPVIAGAQLLEGVGDGVRSGQYGQAMLPVLIDSTPIGRSLGSMVKKVFGGFKKPKRVDRDASSSTNDTSTNQRESGQDNDGLRVEQPYRSSNFADETKLQQHFEKHGTEFGARSADEYLSIARGVMQNGDRVQYMYRGELRTGFVQFMGNNRRGQSKFAFVGTNNQGQITTLHAKSGKDFWKTLNGNAQDRTIYPVE